MLGENHSLANDFPEHIDKIRELKDQNSEFKTMVDAYHNLDHRIRGLECNGVPVEDLYFTQLKRTRANLKDRIHAFLK